jgi:hypothetical protein
MDLALPNVLGLRVGMISQTYRRSKTLCLNSFLVSARSQDFYDRGPCPGHPRVAETASIYPVFWLGPGLAATGNMVDGRGSKCLVNDLIRAGTRILFKHHSHEVRNAIESICKPAKYLKPYKLPPIYSKSGKLRQNFTVVRLEEQPYRRAQRVDQKCTKLFKPC